MNENEKWFDEQIEGMMTDGQWVKLKAVDYVQLDGTFHTYELAVILDALERMPK